MKFTFIAKQYATIKVLQNYRVRCITVRNGENIISFILIYFLRSRFRQDGIVYDPTAIVQQSVVPYSPTGFPIYKNMLLLTKLLPVNQFNLPTDSLTPEEKVKIL